MSEYNHTVCVNTALINKHIDLLDDKARSLANVYASMVSIFRDQLETCECIEDINDDLSFEVQYMIERDAWDTTTEEVLKSIYSDFDIKGAK